jgi:predicted nuclease of restriction endonuclease-like (RecB) superfamily
MAEERSKEASTKPARSGGRVGSAEQVAIGSSDIDGVLRDVRALVTASREQTARVVNAAMVLTYWSIGERIQREILGHERAEYGKEVVARLSEHLAAEYGSGFSRSNLFNMLRFADVFPDHEIVQTLSGLLTWSHLCELVYIEEPLRREFYAQMCATEQWSVRTLRKKIDGMLFERTAVSRKPEKLAAQELAALREEDRMGPALVFRDPYVLDFLDLQETYSEKDLEDAILRELERFMIELGTDFAFVARQKRMTIDNTHYRLDLLFFHRRLRRLIAIDLKLGRFQAADKGQMELYLRWLGSRKQVACGDRGRARPDGGEDGRSRAGRELIPRVQSDGPNSRAAATCGTPVRPPYILVGRAKGIPRGLYSSVLFCVFLVHRRLGCSVPGNAPLIFRMK